MNRFLLSVLLIGGIFNFSQGQTSTLPVKGWAKNSINAVIFRKNSVVSHNNHQFTSYYNADGFVVLGKRQLGSTTWETKVTPYKGNITDAHNSISVIVDGDGFLHMSWDHHNTTLNYCKSVAPGSLDLGPQITMTGSNETSVSYPEFHLLPDGNLIFLYRDGSSGNGNLVLNSYNTKQKKWRRIHQSLINGEGDRNAYWQVCVDKKGTIHLSWVWRESPDVASNHDLCYAKSTDGGTTWKKSDGTNYTIPIIATSANYAARIPEKSDLINQTSIYGDSSGNPYICSYWKTSGSTIPQYHVVYHDGVKWTTVQASVRKTPFTLIGTGTKKIPVSRPQIIVNDAEGKLKVYIIYRDVEQGDKVSLLHTSDLTTHSWNTLNLTEQSTGSWEPSYDTELWKNKSLLHIFVQRVDQGDGETQGTLHPQEVTILEWKPAPEIISDIMSKQSHATNDQVYIYPNPCAGVCTIKTEGIFTYGIYDLTGELVASGVSAGEASIGEGLPAGVYTVEIQSNSGVRRLKLVKSSSHLVE